MVRVAALLAAAWLLALAASELLRGLRLEAAMRATRAMDVVQLELAFDDSEFHRDRYFLGALAQSGQARAGLLAKIARLKDPELYEPMGTFWDLLGENREGLAVMRLVAKHPNTDAETLASLAAGPNAQSVIHEVLANPRTPRAVLERYYDSTDDLAERGLALNPKTPQRVMERLALSANRTTRMNLAWNRATPREILERLAADADQSVASSAKQALARGKSAP